MSTSTRSTRPSSSSNTSTATASPALLRASVRFYIPTRRIAIRMSEHTRAAMRKRGIPREEHHRGIATKRPRGREGQQGKGPGPRARPLQGTGGAPPRFSRTKTPRLCIAVAARKRPAADLAVRHSRGESQREDSQGSAYSHRDVQPAEDSRRRTGPAAIRCSPCDVVSARSFRLSNGSSTVSGAVGAGEERF